MGNPVKKEKFCSKCDNPEPYTHNGRLCQKCLNVKQQIKYAACNRARSKTTSDADNKMGNAMVRMPWK